MSWTSDKQEEQSHGTPDARIREPGSEIDTRRLQVRFGACNHRADGPDRVSVGKIPEQNPKSCPADDNPHGVVDPDWVSFYGTPVIFHERSS